MAQIVTTELVIDGSGATAGGNVFEQAMASAEQAANSGVEAVSNFNAGLLAIGGGAAAAVVGVKAMLDYVVSANKDLADMATVAHQVGVTLTEFQGLQFGGAISGLSTDQINAGLEKSASLLNDASRNSNSLSKELDANGISVKNANGQLISQNQLLGVAADLIKNAANPGDQLAIAQMLGFTKKWIPLLEQGAGAMSALASEAKAAGAVISDETIAKATEFDAAWRKSSVTFSANMKAALTDILPMLDDMITKAGQFVSSLAAGNGASTGSGQSKFNDWADSLAISARVDDGTASVKDLERAIEILNSHHTAVPPELIDQLEQLKAEAAAAAASVSAVNNATQAANFPGGVPLPGSRPAGIGAGDGSSVVASKDTANDAVDRAINQLQKHTLAQVADAQAVGLGDAALAGFKATAAETAAVQANQGKETDDQKAKFASLKDAASAAAGALAAAKVASNIEFNTKTAFLSADDVAIATQLKGIYGNDVPAALNSTYASAIRLNDAFKSMSSGIENNLVTGLTDIATASVTAGQGFTNMGLAVLKTIEQMIIKISIVQPLMQAFQTSVNGTGILGLLGLGGANPIAAGGVVPGAVGPTSVGGGALVGLHGGGIVGSEATFSRYVHPSYFDNAPKFHSGGIAGDEVPIIAKKGEGVFTPGQMAAMGGGGQTVINYSPNIDARGADAQAVARLAAAQAQDRQNFERNVQGVMAKTRQNNPGT